LCDIDLEILLLVGVSSNYSKMEEHILLREYIKTRMKEQLSVLAPWGYDFSSCGYCKSSPLKTSPNYYAGSKKQDVHPLHYQVMADRGWRRSGTTYYKPNVKHACCPHYTIRCNANAFTPNRSHRKVINRWNAYIQGSDYRYKAKRLCPRSKEDKKQQRNNFEFISKLHTSEDTHMLHPIDPKTSNPIRPEHKFTVALEPDTFTEEKWALYEHYQRRVHKDITTRSSFRNFLCTGLPRSTYTPPVYEGTPARMIGSYHAVYRLDGKIVAIGVLDLLPYGVSSVYLMYHESVSAFAIGKLAALWEIALAREKGYGWYYMGYYIHSCTKMQYKRGYGETYILDPEGIDEGKWDRLDEKMLKLMDEKK
jgi:arginine-tRNA-protein transferase